MAKVKCAILGATGTVGQKFAVLTENHPLFEISALGASGKSAGQKYGDVVIWKQDRPIPSTVKDLVVRPCRADEFYDCQVIFSALPTENATELESELANLGHYVFSNASSHRMDPDVPILLPMVNPKHIRLIEKQTSFAKNGGFIITNSNCACAGLVTALRVIDELSPIETVTAATLQAVSGSGYPGMSSYDMIGNIVPFINGEEVKTEVETRKILGELDMNLGSIIDNSVKVTTMVHRVPVIDGHTVSFSVKTKDPITPESVITAIKTHKIADINVLKGLSTPTKMIKYLDEPDRPQPRVDINEGNGFTTIVGRVRPCSVNTLRMVTLSHNTVLGAAGGSLMNAEFAFNTGYVVPSKS